MHLLWKPFKPGLWGSSGARLGLNLGHGAAELVV